MTSAQYAKSINTLSRVTLISTNQSTDSKENMRKCVNALRRAITISTRQKKQKLFTHITVSMPSDEQ